MDAKLIRATKKNVKRLCEGYNFVLFESEKETYMFDYMQPDKWVVMRYDYYRDTFTAVDCVSQQEICRLANKHARIFAFSANIAYCNSNVSSNFKIVIKANELIEVL